MIILKILLLLGITFFLFLYIKNIINIKKPYDNEEIPKNITCNSNEILYNSKCKKIKTINDCIIENKFYIPNKNTKNTSCIQISNDKKIEYCKNKKLIFYGNDCRKEKTNSKCKKDNIFFKLDKNTKNTSCIEMTNNEKKKYCKSINKIYYGNICLKKKNFSDCQKINIFHKPDINTENTSCILIKNKDEKIKHCKKLGLVFYKNNCIKPLPMILYLSKKKCKKGCGFRSIKKNNFCIDGYGPGMKKCKEIISNDESNIIWIKNESKTRRFYDVKKNCFDKNSIFYEDFDNCHDINNKSTWDIVKHKRNKYIGTEDFNCTNTNLELGLEGNNINCTWKTKDEVDLNKCDGTVTRTYECIDDNEKIASNNRCDISLKPKSKISKNNHCQLKIGKWGNTFISNNDSNKICNSCGITDQIKITRNIECIRDDGRKLLISECNNHENLEKQKYCQTTNDCNCTCPNGKPINTDKCNNKYIFKKHNNSVIDCSSCNFGYTLENYKNEYNLNSKKCIKSFTKKIRGHTKCVTTLFNTDKKECTNKCMKDKNCNIMCVVDNKCAMIKICRQPEGWFQKTALKNVKMECYEKH
jgi:hypothetical protein